VSDVDNLHIKPTEVMAHDKPAGDNTHDCIFLRAWDCRSPADAENQRLKDAAFNLSLVVTGP
jgi:hypothetical protein